MDLINNKQEIVLLDIVLSVVPCSGKGVCADPRSGDATFGVGGPGPPTTENGQ